MTDAPRTARRTITFRTKLAFGIAIASLVPLVTSAVVAYVLGRQGLVDSAEDQLSLMRDEKIRSLQEYFGSMARSARLFAAGPVVRDGLASLAAAWSKLPGELGWPAEGPAGDGAGAARREESLKALAEYHLARAGRGGEGPSRGSAGDSFPSDPASQAAQVLFLSENPNPPGMKHLLARPARVTTAYGEVHARVQGYAAATLRELAWDDLLLVDAATGTVVYSYAKEADFGTSVRDGPFAATGMGRAARRALESSAEGGVVWEDFDFYAPSDGRIAGFLAVPIRSDSRTAGVLVAQVPITHVTEVLAPEPGAPRTTETYLVGSDHLMRSQSIFSAEPTALRKKVESHAVRESLGGDTGIGEAPDYRGVASILAWAPVDLLGVRYGLVRKLDAEQALQPVTRLLTWLGVLTVVLFLAALGAGILLSRTLSRPVAHATERLQGMAQSLLSTAQEQQAGAAESAAAVEETRQTFQGVLAAAQNLRKVGTEVLANAEVSQRNAQTIGRRIQDLSGSTANIGQILALVKEIANRSDLLALNAALEGTKAGEAGRGFSLVATQMQRLAEEVMASVKKIEGLTQDISKASAGAVLAAEEADKVATHTTGSAQHIAEAVQTQQAATEQVSVAMNEIATVAQQSVEAARHIVGSSNELLGLANDLRRVMGTGT